jgi:nicotinamidase-related amidase
VKMQSAFLIIDVQQGFFDETDAEDAAFLKHPAGLLERAREQQIPIVYIQHEGDPGHLLEVGTSGWHIHPWIAPHPEDIVLSKCASDAFYETPLHEKLHSRGGTRLVVAGAQTELCIDSTCRRALSLDYDVCLVADGHTTGGSDMLSVDQTIEYHNRLLPHVAHPTHSISVQSASTVQF